MPTSTSPPRSRLARGTPAASIGTRTRGFTLIELMIAVTVIGILSSLALPSFEGQLQRARRADVLVSMMHIQLAQERFRSNASAYGSLAQIGVPSASAASHYALDASASGSDGYVALATATGLQARDRDCRHMRLSVVGGNPSYASGTDAALGNDSGVNRRCWLL